jgi:hypothetical protein
MVLATAGADLPEMKRGRYVGLRQAALHRARRYRQRDGGSIPENRCKVDRTGKKVSEQGLRAPELAIVLGVRSDPHPKDGLGVSDGHGSVMNTDAHGPNPLTATTDGFEMKSRVERILAKELIGVAGLPLRRLR